MSAKLALAAVALTSVMFTSCEKEEFNVAPVELDPASATITVTVYDMSDGSIITDANVAGDFAVNPGADGKIAATERTFTATKDGYLSGEGVAKVPALNKGQFALVPVSIYLQKLADAAQPVGEDKVEETAKVDEVPDSQEAGENTGDEPKSMDLEYTAKVGQEVVNLAEVEKSIEAMAVTKALSDGEVKKVLKAFVGSYNTGIKDVTYTKTVMVPAKSIVTLEVVTEYETADYTITAKVDGKEYSIPNVRIKKVIANSVTPVFTSTDHGHGHGHGNGDNAGGGAGAAE